MKKHLLNILICLAFQFIGEEVSAQDTTPPDRPLITYVTVDTTNNDVLIYWDFSSSSDVEWYFIYYEVFTVNGYEGIKIDSVNASTSTYRHSGTKAGQKNLLYSVTAADSSGNESLRTPGFHSTVHLDMQYDSCMNTMSLQWNNYIGWNEDLTGYKVFRSIDNGNFTVVNGNLPGDSLYTDHNIIENAIYRYYIEAVKYDGLVSTSNISQKYTYMPPPPSNLELLYVTISDPNTAGISFSFDPSSIINDFVLLRSAIPTSDFLPIDHANDVASETFTFADQFTTSFKKYFYKIGALNSCNKLILSSNIGVNILLSADTSQNQVQLNWNPYEDWQEGISFYSVSRMNENGEFTEIAHLSSMTTNYLDDLTNVSPNSLSGKLLYRVEARRNGSTISAFSNIAEVKIHSVFDKIPNAFTPNNDGLNDTFKPLINFIPEKFLMIIYDRYGIPVFQTENPEEGWDGKIRGKGMAIEGVYIYHVQYTSYGGTSNKKTGKVTVFYPRQ